MNDEQSKMVIENQKLIYMCLKKLKMYHKCDEYFDIGMIGLCKGVKTFDETKCIAASTYLSKCIYNEILCSFRKKQISAITLDTKISENLTLYDVIEDKNFNLESEIIKNDELETIKNIICNLSKREQFVLNHYFDINGYKHMNQIEIAKELNVSQPQVNRIKRNGINKIKMELRSNQEE